MPRVLIALAVALVLAGAAHAQPNVVVVVTDDQRWDTLGYMPTVTNELVGKGVTFSNAFVVNAVCCPSRASILTGEWSHTTGVWGVTGPTGGFNVFDDRETLPVWLDRAGYETMLAGKYLNEYVDAGYVPPGWDRWFANTTNQNAYFDWGASDGGAETSFGSEPADYSTDVLAARAVDFVRSSGEEPFFLYFAPKAPHYDTFGSVTPAPRHAGAFAGLEPWAPPSLNEQWIGDKPRYVQRHPLAVERIAEFRQDQLESLLAVDEAVAALLAALEETGKLADTLIVFTSDNGHNWGEHRRLNKVAPYEESIRVPLVVRWDAAALAVEADSRLALNVDLAETVAAAAGVQVDTGGRSLLPSEGGPRWRRSFLFESDLWPDRRVPAYCAFRSAAWKYVQYATGEEELYDLRRDPYELRNQARSAGQVARIINYRRAVRQSACRPPHYPRPLTACTRTGTGRADRIRGWRRADWICAGRGADRINVRRGGRDVVRCGRGRDRVVAGRADTVARSCERVLRPGFARR